MKTILLPVHDDLGAESRLQVACDLARAARGHVRCVQVTPMPEMIAAEAYDGIGYATVVAAELHAIDEAFRTRTEAHFAREDVAWDWRQRQGDSLAGLLAAAKLADIIVASLPGDGRGGMSDPLPIVPDLVLGGRTPVLAVPTATTSMAVAGRALVAWDGSAAAAAALRAAVPLLQLAEAVDIVTVEDVASATPATDAPEYLARHGVKAELHSWPRAGRPVEIALCDAMAHLRADWVVMGAFGHSRWRELIFGGVTRSLLRTAAVPLLLAH